MTVAIAGGHGNIAAIRVALMAVLERHGFGGAEDGVESGGELPAVVADEGLEPLGLFAEVHECIAGHLRGPLGCGVGGGAEDVDASGGVLDHGQDICGGAVEEVDGEEVGGEDRFGLGAQEACPGRVGSS